MRSFPRSRWILFLIASSLCNDQHQQHHCNTNAVMAFTVISNNIHTNRRLRISQSSDGATTAAHVIPSGSSSMTALQSIASMSSSVPPSQSQQLRFGHLGFSGPLGLSSRQKIGSIVSLHAKRNRYDDDDDSYSSRRGRKKKSKRNNNKWDDNDDDDNEDGSVMESTDWDDDETVSESNGNQYVKNVKAASGAVKVAVAALLAKEQWDLATTTTLDAEKMREASCWKYRDEFRTAIARVGEGLVEREEESRLVVLAMIAGEHILLLGVPGTGKSQLGRRLSKLCGGSFFQRLLTRFTTPEEIFGPLSLKALENDEYRRCTDGFLPTASVAFLDEIFKANSAILNTLLTILNERKFDNGAGNQEDCPVRCVVGASNELPESDELDALYDRFLLRKEVHPVSDKGLIEMLSMSNPGLSASDDDGEDAACDIVFTNGLDSIIGDLTVAINDVVLGEETAALMRDLRTFLREDQSLDVSDRRLVKAARLLKICAASHGRNRVDPIDCLLLQHMTWQLPEQRAVVMDWLWEHLTPGETRNGEALAAGSVPQFRLLLDGLRSEAIALIRKTSGDVNGTSGARPDEIAAIQALQVESDRMVHILKQKEVDLFRHMELLRRGADDHLWLDPDTTLSAKQLLLPRAEAVAVALNKALVDAAGLALCLSDNNNVIDNDTRLSVVEHLWEEGYSSEISFTEAEMAMGMRDAKAKYDLETFRRWKRARKKQI